jgi:hypothetical protein
MIKSGLFLFLAILTMAICGVGEAAHSPKILRVKALGKMRRVNPTTRLLYGDVGSFQGGQTIASAPKVLK